jgi:hypothetical protein
MLPECGVCGGKSVVLAAPISIPTNISRYYRKPIWAKAVAVPCFACRTINVLEAS